MKKRATPIIAAVIAVCTMACPAMAAEAGFVPWADAGISTTLR